MLKLFSKKEHLKDWEFVQHMFGSKAAHLVLGITCEGMLRFLAHREVGFLVWNDASGDEDYTEVDGWIYNKNCVVLL